jgi:hypothetical protein
MPLTKRDTWWHAGSEADLDEYLVKHVLKVHRRGRTYHVSHATCPACSSRAFNLYTDRRDRVMRECTGCKAMHNVCDLDEGFDMGSAGEKVCPCCYSECEVAVGFAYRAGKVTDAKTRAASPDVVEYLYVAGRCTRCGLCGVYGEWAAKRGIPAAEWFASA